MPYSRPYASGFVDYPSTTTPINSTALNTMDVGIKTANDQFQTVTTAQRTALVPTVGQCVWDSDLRQLMVFMNASGGNAWQPIGNAIVCTSTTRPATPFEGQVIRETDTNKEFTYSGAAWVQTNTWGTTSGVTGVSNLIVPATLRLSRSAVQSIPNATDTLVTWTVEDLDTDGMFSSGTDITVQTAGIYTVSAGVTFASNATGVRFVEILKNSTAVGGSIAAQATTNTGASSSCPLNATCTVSLAASDVIRVNVYQTSGGALNMGGVAGTFEGGSTFVSMAWVGRAS